MQDAPARPEAETALPLRNDTMLGVCQAIGDDAGFNPNYLRVALGSLVMLSPLAAFGIYFALGIGVVVSRWLFPAPRSALAIVENALAADADVDADRLPLAA